MTNAAAAMERLGEDGYAIVRGVLDPATVIVPVEREFAAILDSAARELHAAGRITDIHADLPFGERLIAVQRDAGMDLAVRFDPTLPASKISMTDEINLGDAIFGLMTDARLLDVVSDVLGPDISLNPVNHVRMKVPLGDSPGRVGALTGTTPWHQDRAACLSDADDSRIVIAWIPLNQPSVETGTLQVVPRSHKQGLLDHSAPDPTVRAGSIEIPERDVDTASAMPILIDPGDIVLMTMDIVHGSLPNRSVGRVRMSAEIRFQRTGDHSGRNPALPTLPLLENGRRTDLDAETWRWTWLAAREELSNESAIKWHRW